MYTFWKLPHSRCRHTPTDKHTLPVPSPCTPPRVVDMWMMCVAIRNSLPVILNCSMFVLHSPSTISAALSQSQWQFISVVAGVTLLLDLLSGPQCCRCQAVGSVCPHLVPLCKYLHICGVATVCWIVVVLICLSLNVCGCDDTSAQALSTCFRVASPSCTTCARTRMYVRR